METGVIAVDLGWMDAGRTLRRGLERLGADSSRVVAVFLTHAHRDHVGAWKRLRHAAFHMAAPEVPVFLGLRRAGGWIPRLSERLLPSDRPAEGEVRVVAFAGDSAFAFGADTVRAFLLPGHTPGSAAYLFRGTLFVGDALARPPLLGFGAAPPGFSEDPERSGRSLDDLWERLEPYRVERVCTAHAKCARYTADFRRRMEGW